MKTKTVVVKWIAQSALIACVAGLAGCGGSSGGEADSSAPTSTSTPTPTPTPTPTTTPTPTPTPTPTAEDTYRVSAGWNSFLDHTGAHPFTVKGVFSTGDSFTGSGNLVSGASVPETSNGLSVRKKSISLLGTLNFS